MNSSDSHFHDDHCPEPEVGTPEMPGRQTSNDKTADEKAGTPFIIISANCAGGARAIGWSQHSVSDRSRSVGDFVQRIAEGDSRPHATIVGFQELCRYNAQISSQTDFVEMLNLPPGSEEFYFASNVSTALYPIKAKWGARWEANSCHAEQGIAACALHGARLRDPECNAPPRSMGSSPFKGAVINLPVVKFCSATECERAPEKPWRTIFKHRFAATGAENEMAFRFSRYLGSRDTEPRLATAHRVTLDGAASGTDAFIFIHVHLTTLQERHSSGLPTGDNSIPAHWPAAESLRYLQLAEICDFIWEIYESSGLPVVVAGDFNTSPDRPDMGQFMKDAHLQAVFRSDRCWACSGEPLAHPRQVYTSEANPHVLTTSESAYLDLTRDSPKTRETTAFCRECQRPLFTAKRRFRLVDNILFTADVPSGVALRSTITLDDPTTDAGIALDTCFSDHFPVWAQFRLVPTSLSTPDSGCKRMPSE